MLNLKIGASFFAIYGAAACLAWWVTGSVVTALIVAVVLLMIDALTESFKLDSLERRVQVLEQRQTDRYA